MDEIGSRIEAALGAAFASLKDRAGPARLASALRYAVIPGGARLRPRLVVEVARALGDPEPRTTDAAAIALELIHCASLVHDDLPCFDGAELRRGRPTLHTAFDEPTAVLVGDGLIVMAFQVIAHARPERIADLTLALCQGVGHPAGIVAGQAWESEGAAGIHVYHRAKTAALFEAACAMGAISAGADPSAWRFVGELLGRAYQIADDVADATLSSELLGKSVGRDAEKRRPNAIERLGEDRCRDLVEALLREAGDAVPACAGRDHLRRWLRDVSLGVLRHRVPGFDSGAASARHETSAGDEAPHWTAAE